MKKLFLVACILCLAACSNGVPADLKSSEKSISILSFLGSRYNSLENTRPTNASIEQEFNTLNAAAPILDASEIDISDFYAGSQMKRWSHDVVDWGIDRYAVDAVRQQLAKSYRIVDFAYDPADLDYEGDFAAFVHEKTGKIGEAIRRQAGYAQAKDVDAYVLLLPAEQDFTILNRRSHGIGIIRDFLAFGEGQQIGDGVYMLHALYNVAVLDAHTFNLLAVAVAQHDTLYQNRFRGNPAVFVDNSYWADSYDRLSPAKRDEIVAEIKGMIDATLPRTLQGIDLLP